MTKSFVAVNSDSLIFEGHDGPELCLLDLDEVSWEEASRLLQDFEEEAYASSSFEGGGDSWDMTEEEYEALRASCEEDEDD